MRTSLVSGTTLLPILVVFTMQCVECKGGVTTARGITLVTYLDETTAEGATEYLMSTVETMKSTNVHKSTSVSERHYTSKEVTVSESTTKFIPTSKGVMPEGTVTPTGVTEPSVNPDRVRNWVVICSITIVAGLAILCTIALSCRYCLKQKKLRQSRTDPVLFQLTPADSIETHENADTLGIDNPLYNIDLELTKIQLGPSS